MTAPAPQNSFTPALRSAQHVFAPIQREIDRLVDQASASWSNLMAFDVPAFMDVRDTDAGFEITLEAPGVSADEIKITVEDHVLTIAGEKTANQQRAEAGYRVSERSFGSFERRVTLPSSVDAEKITASMSDGVLTILAPREAKAAATSIPIQTM